MKEDFFMLSNLSIHLFIEVATFFNIFPNCKYFIKGYPLKIEV